MLSVSFRNTFPLRQVLTVAIGACIMILGSKIQISQVPVPFTFQTVGALFIAMTYSPMSAFLSLLTWLTMGASGLSVFAKSASGAATLMGPTAGYLWGMLLAATLMSACQFYCAGFFNGLFSKKAHQEGDYLNFPATVFVGCLGAVLILMMGWINLSQYIGPVPAWNYGVLPFLMMEFLKAIGVAGIVSTFQLGKIGR